MGDHGDPPFDFGFVVDDGDQSGTQPDLREMFEQLDEVLPGPPVVRIQLGQDYLVADEFT